MKEGQVFTWGVVLGPVGGEGGGGRPGGVRQGQHPPPLGLGREGLARYHGGEEKNTFRKSKQAPYFRDEG